MKPEYVNIHTHCPTGQGIELHTAGIHPWEAAGADLAALEGVLAGASGCSAEKLPAAVQGAASAAEGVSASDAQGSAPTAQGASVAPERPSAPGTAAMLKPDGASANAGKEPLTAGTAGLPFPDEMPASTGSGLRQSAGIAAKKVQALGETGLDAVRGPEHAVQLRAFRSQLALARRYDLPVVLHCVRAFEEVMRELAVCEPRAVIFHGFIGSPEQARRAVGRGYWLSFGERAFASPRTLEALRSVPLGHVFFETDDSPTPISEIYRRAAEVLGTGVEALQRAAMENYERIFAAGRAPSCGKETPGRELKKER